MRLAASGHAALLHGLEQGGLRLGRGAVDLVGQDQVREEWPFDEAEVAAPRGSIFLDDLGARDVRGHEVGRELDAFEGEVEELGQRRDEQRLGQPRNADKEAVAAREEADEQVIDGRFLTDDAPPQRGLDVLAAAGDGFDRGAGFFLCQRLPVGRRRAALCR